MAKKPKPANKPDDAQQPAGDAGDETRGVEPGTEPSAETQIAERTTERATTKPAEEAIPREKDHRQRAREAIVERAREKREAERAALANESPEQQAIRRNMQAVALGSEETPDSTPPSDVEGDAAAAGKPDGGEPPAPSPAAAAEPYDPWQAYQRGDESITVEVYGKTKTFTRPEFEKRLKAGAMQLEAASDRLRELSEYDTRLRQTYEQFTRWEQNLRQGLDREGKPLQTSAQKATDAALPAQDEPAGLSREELRKIAESFYTGDPDEVTKGLEKLVSSQGRGQQAPTPSLEEQAEAAAEKALRKRDLELERKEANEAFAKAYPTFDQNPHQLAAVRSFLGTVQADPEFQNRSLKEQVLEAGRRNAESLGLPTHDAPAPPPPGGNERIAARRDAKRAFIQPPPTAAGVRTPAPPTPQPKTRSEVVKTMRRWRGLTQ